MEFPFLTSKLAISNTLRWISSTKLYLPWPKKWERRFVVLLFALCFFCHPGLSATYPASLYSSTLTFLWHNDWWVCWCSCSRAIGYCYSLHYTWWQGCWMFLENTDCAWWQRCDFYLHANFQWVCVLLLLGATLHEAVLQTLHEWGLALPRFLSCSTDGAGAMLGHRSGFMVVSKQITKMQSMFTAVLIAVGWIFVICLIVMIVSNTRSRIHLDNSTTIMTILQRGLEHCRMWKKRWVLILSQAERAQHYALVYMNNLKTSLRKVAPSSIVNALVHTKSKNGCS